MLWREARHFVCWRYLRNWPDWQGLCVEFHSERELSYRNLRRIELLSFVLRPVLESDLKILLRWRNSDRIRKISYRDHEISWDEHCRWFKNLEQSQDRKSFIFEIKERPVGTVNFTDIDYKNLRCRWGFYLGEEDLKRGTGTEMGRLALDYVFDSLKLEKVCAETFDWNEASIAYHLKLGFHREGLLRKHQLKNKKFSDLILFGLLREEWQMRRKELGAQ